MKRLPLILQMAVRVLGLAVLVLGIFLWRHGETHQSLEHAHESLAILLVLAVFALAFLAAKAKVNTTFIAVAVIWGLAAPILGFAQTGMNGGPSVAVKIVHLIVGLGLIGLGEGLGARIKRAS
ncbi:MAG TPA: hypothetical protein VFW71_12990 [Actinomycetota bacterium]|nr:hypothetical protein [Actinomycetota bacterium]